MVFIEMLKCAASNAVENCHFNLLFMNVIRAAKALCMNLKRTRSQAYSYDDVRFFLRTNFIVFNMIYRLTATIKLHHVLSPL